MPTTHTWNPNDSGYIYDTNDYTDGTAFTAGDTLVVNGGTPNAQSLNGNVATLFPGTYQFNASSAGEGVSLKNMALPGGGTIAEGGQNAFTWSNFGQFVNGGTVQVGSTTASGNVDYVMNDDTAPGDASFTNNGTMLLQNGSLFRIQTDNTTNGTFLNAAGAVMSVNSGSTFSQSNYFGSPNTAFTNDGLVAVNGTAGQTTDVNLAANYQGTGLLSVRGAPGAAPAETSAILDGPSNGTFDVASGNLQFYTDPAGGSINFLDNNGEVIVHSGPGLANSEPNPFRATIYGFQSGDSVYLDDTYAVTQLSYNASTHLLSLNTSNGMPEAQFAIAGNYAYTDFHVATNSTGVGPLTITTTSSAQAVPSFAYQDTTTNAVATDPGQQYTGPVDYLQSQYIWAGQNSANVTAHVPNVFLKGGPGNDALAANSGSNVLDGDTGSNFLVGASGADGGNDTFFLDGSIGTTWDTIVNFHPGDSVTLWGYVPGQSVMSWAANDGTPGYTGATIHASFAGTGTPVNGSVTFAGVSLANAQSNFTTSSGTVGGRDYLNVHYNA